MSRISCHHARRLPLGRRTGSGSDLRFLMPAAGEGFAALGFAAGGGGGGGSTFGGVEALPALVRRAGAGEVPIRPEPRLVTPGDDERLLAGAGDFDCERGGACALASC